VGVLQIGLIIVSVMLVVYLVLVVWT